MTNFHGSLEVVCGSMFSGKTEELLRRIRRAEIANRKVLILKNNIDTRSGKAIISTHSGHERTAHPIENSSERLWDIVTLAKKFDVIGFDEVQFFHHEVVVIIEELVRSGKKIIVAGLDLDFRGEPFPVVAHLLALADSITKLKAICVSCGEDAHHTQRVINGVPASYNDQVIMVGAAESYKAHCRNCFVVLNKPTSKISFLINKELFPETHST